MLELSQKITLLITAVFALIFTALGIGILFSFFLPGSQLTTGTRLTFGGLILLYGLFRGVTVIRKYRKSNQEKSTITVEGQGDNQ
jgi:hypothetical protein